MENSKTIKQLSVIMPFLKDLKFKLKQIEEKFSDIAYYKKFKFYMDAPSIIPVYEVQRFTELIETSKEFLLKFKETFNENELPKDIRKTFLSTFLLIVKEGLESKDGSVCLGGTANLWKKEVNYVLENWEQMPYKQKVGYSQQAYLHITSYFPLIDLIGQLEKKLV